MCIRDSLGAALPLGALYYTYQASLEWVAANNLMFLTLLPIPIIMGEPVSYTHLDVYKRQGMESGQVEAVMDGALDPFIEAFLRWQARYQKRATIPEEGQS